MMSPKIICPHCNKEFKMEEGLTSHFKTLAEKKDQEFQKTNAEKIRKYEQKNLELLDANKKKDVEIKSINEQKDKDIKKAVKDAVDEKLKIKDKENKAHYQSLLETQIKAQKENLSEQNSEKQKVWELKEKRLIATIEDLQKKQHKGLQLIKVLLLKCN